MSTDGRCLVTIWRDGQVIKQHPGGRLERLPDAEPVDKPAKPSVDKAAKPSAKSAVK